MDCISYSVNLPAWVMPVIKKKYKNCTDGILPDTVLQETRNDRLADTITLIKPVSVNCTQTGFKVVLGVTG